MTLLTIRHSGPFRPCGRRGDRERPGLVQRSRTDRLEVVSDDVPKNHRVTRYAALFLEVAQRAGQCVGQQVDVRQRCAVRVQSNMEHCCDMMLTPRPTRGREPTARTGEPPATPRRRRTAARWASGTLVTTVSHNSGAHWPTSHPQQRMQRRPRPIDQHRNRPHQGRTAGTRPLLPSITHARPPGDAPDPAHRRAGTQVTRTTGCRRPPLRRTLVHSG